MPTKGFCANAFENVAHTNALGGNLLRVSWGEWLVQNNTQYGNTRVVIDLSSIDPAFPLTVPNLELVAVHSCYCGKFLMGNEPYLNSYTPQQFADAVIPQMDLVQLVDPNALFGIAAGINGKTQAWMQYPALWYEANSWWSNMFPLLPARFRKKSAIALHAYAEFENDVNKSVGLIEFLSDSNAFRDANYPNKQLWLSEVGRANTSGSAQYNPTNIHAKCTTHDFAWWAWYAQQPIATAENYYCLQNTDGTLTQYGQDFVGI